MVALREKFDVDGDQTMTLAPRTCWLCFSWHGNSLWCRGLCSIRAYLNFRPQVSPNRDARAMHRRQSSKDWRVKFRKCRVMQLPAMTCWRTWSSVEVGRRRTSNAQRRFSTSLTKTLLARWAWMSSTGRMQRCSLKSRTGVCVTSRYREEPKLELQKEEAVKEAGQLSACGNGTRGTAKSWARLHESSKFVRGQGCLDGLPDFVSELGCLVSLDVFRPWPVGRREAGSEARFAFHRQTHFAECRGPALDFSVLRPRAGHEDTRAKHQEHDSWCCQWCLDSDYLDWMLGPSSCLQSGFEGSTQILWLLGPDPCFGIGLSWWRFVFSRWNYANPRTALQVGYKIKKARDRSRCLPSVLRSRHAPDVLGAWSDKGLGRFRSLSRNDSCHKRKESTQQHGWIRMEQVIFNARTLGGSTRVFRQKAVKRSFNDKWGHLVLVLLCSC